MDRSAKHHDLFATAAANTVLDYLENHLAGYPFDPDLDRPFVAELLDDFAHLDLLEQIKIFRWYRDGRPIGHHPRATLRRWLAGAQRRRS